jgi:general secretion pathway protein A
MYLDFYGFREKPFNLTPDPRFVFLSRNHREAFAHLLYGISNRVGFISLTGEVGSGKTTVLRALLNQLDADRYRTALIFNPRLSGPELLQSINRELGISSPSSDHSSPLDALNSFLLQQNAEGRIVVLVIDEVQNLEAPVLEQIRLISNLETDREKLIQIVLSGQPEFAQTLEKKEMRQLSQRITVRYHLQPLDFQDTVGYINHRLVTAGGKGGNLFSRRALKRIYHYSQGLPRLISAVCDRALLAGYTGDTARISSRIADVAIRDMKRNTASDTRKRRLILLPIFVIFAAFLAAVIYLNRHDFITRFNASQPMETKEEEKNKESSVTEEELSRAMAAELGKVPEPESAQRAFNALAGLWTVPPIPENEQLSQLNTIERAARDRKLRFHRFSGSLGALLRIDYPAVLELTFPGIPGKRFVSLVGTEDGKFLIDPPIAGRDSLSFSETEKYWSGQGFILWKDPLNFPASITPASKGSHVRELQGLLREVEAYSKPLTGVYDGDTLSAVKEFQSSKGIAQDGIVGDQTLMLLYRCIDRFEAPRLTGGRK